MQTVIDFVLGHQVVLAGMIVAILDLLFALIPGIKSNGILHAAYNFVKGIVSKEKSPA